MPARDHPNNAPSLPMLFPAWFDRLQLKYLNPAMRRMAPYLPTFTVVKHHGRKSGRAYETVVNAYRKGSLLAILLGHGNTDWVKNVLAAGEADLQVSGRHMHIANPQVLPAGSDSTGLPGLPLLARIAVRRMGVLVADIA
jgi:deazaflavin-dependent oxidoreductase (nitroreductase family)